MGRDFANCTVGFGENIDFSVSAQVKPQVSLRIFENARRGCFKPAIEYIQFHDRRLSSGLERLGVGKKQRAIRKTVENIGANWGISRLG